MGYIYWDEIIKDIQNIPMTKLKAYELLIQHKKNTTNLENLALIAIQAELGRRDGI